MQTELVVPLVEDNENYADSLTADYCGLDLHIDGETYSASFEDVDRAELALAILDDDAYAELSDNELHKFAVAMVNSVTTDVDPYKDVEEFFEAVAFMALALLKRRKANLAAFFGDVQA